MKNIILLVVIGVSISAAVSGLLSLSGIEYIGARDFENPTFWEKIQSVAFWLSEKYQEIIHPMVLDALGLPKDASPTLIVTDLLATLGGIAGLYAGIRGFRSE